MAARKIKQVVKVLNPDGPNGPTVHEIVCANFTSDAACLTFGLEEAARWTHHHLLALAGKETGVDPRELPDVIEAMGLSKHPYTRTWRVKGDALVLHAGLDQVQLQASVYSVNTSRGRMLWKSGAAQAYADMVGRELARLRPAPARARK